MARLGPDEIGAIETAVRRMSENLADGRSALGFKPSDGTLLNATLSTDPGGFFDVDLDVSLIRAIYHPDICSIVLTGTTWHTSQPLGKTTLAAFETMVIGALAHEACHLLQHRESPQMFGKGSEAETAEMLSRKVWCSQMPEDYVAYVSCELEMEAHATQLAAQLRSSGELVRADFNVSAKASPLVAHIKRNSSTADGVEWPAWSALEATLLNEAWIASELIWGRSEKENKAPGPLPIV